MRCEDEGVGVDLGEGFWVLEDGVAEASEEGAVLVGEGGILEDYFGNVVFDALGVSVSVARDGVGVPLWFEERQICTYLALPGSPLVQQAEPMSLHMLRDSPIPGRHIS